MMETDEEKKTCEDVLQEFMEEDDSETFTKV